MWSQSLLTKQYSIYWLKFDRPKCQDRQVLIVHSNGHTQGKSLLHILAIGFAIYIIPLKSRFIVLFSSRSLLSHIVILGLLNQSYHSEALLDPSIKTKPKIFIFLLMSPIWPQSVSNPPYILIQYSGTSSDKFQRWIGCRQYRSNISRFTKLRLICYQPRFIYNHTIAQVFGMLLLLISYSLTMTQANDVSSLSAGTDHISLGDAESPQPQISSWATDQAKSHCVDSNGTMRGLFSTWTEYPDCHCTCYPNARLAISVCDGCVVGVSPDVSANLPTTGFGGERKPIPRSEDAVNGMINEADASADDGPIHHGENKRRGCVYKLTGASYQHAEIWMSAEQPCVKCHCQDGTITCAGEPHHCPPLCLPGQQTLGPGPCCETVCRGTAVNGNSSINFSDCPLTRTGMNHTHGELVTLSGSCVDQKCLCVNGRWHCLDYCVPLEQLPCPRDHVIVWDPFCCPRCPGNQTCNTHASLLQTPNMTGSEQMQLGGTIELNTGDKHGNDQDQDSEEVDQSPLSDGTASSTLLVIGPGRGVALPQGRCYCVNSKLHCARPGRHIWHDQDCYFVDRHETTYYPPNARWTPTGDPCTRCQCLQNQSYTCAPKRCTRTFICPQGQQPLIRPGECCPSYCGVSKTLDDASIAIKPQSLSTWSKSNNPVPIRPPSISQLQSERPVELKSVEDSPASSKRLRVGCRSWDGIEVHPTNRFPPGSRLLLTRPCRSLLCVCARDDRWLCTDHCPPCVRTFESIENLQEVPQPPPGRCCPPCNNAMESSSNRFESQGIPNGPEFNLHSPHDQDKVGSMRQDNEPSFADRKRHQHLMSDGWSSGYAQTYGSSFGTDLDDRFENSTHEHIKRTLRLYVLVAALILFCIFGFPLIVFFAWQLVRRRRRRERYQYRTRLLRRRQKLEAMAFAARKRSPFMIPARVAQSAISESPQTSYSHKNDTSPTYASSKEPHSVDVHTDQQETIQQTQAFSWPEDSVCTGTSRTNETDLPALNATTTDVHVRKLIQSVPTTPVSRELSGANSNSKQPRRVQSALQSRRLEMTAMLGPSCFTQANQVKIEPPIPNPVVSKNNTPVRRTLSSVSNKDTTTKPKSRTALNRASTWLGGTYNNNNNMLSVVGCFQRGAFKRNDHLESSSRRAIKLTQLPQDGQSSESFTPSSSTTSEQVETFFANDSPPLVRSTRPDSMVHSHIASPPSPYVIPTNRLSVPPDLPLPSPTRSQHHFIHLNRPTPLKPQTTIQTNGYEMKNTYHNSNLSQPGPKTDPSVSMSESQTPLLSVQHEAVPDTTGSNRSISMTQSPTLFETPMNRAQVDEPNCMAISAHQTADSNEPKITDNSDRLQPRASFVPQRESWSHDKQESSRDKQAIELTFTWPRSKSAQMDPVTSNSLSPSKSVTRHARIYP